MRETIATEQTTPVIENLEPDEHAHNGRGLPPKGTPPTDPRVRFNKSDPRDKGPRKGVGNTRVEPQ